MRHLPLTHRPARAAALIVTLALSAGLAACGGEDDNGTPALPAATSSALLAQIPTLGETYPAQLARFVDTDAGKDYGLAVTVADDGKAVAYLCDGKTLGRAFSGTIDDGADAATLKAVKGDGTVELKLADGTPLAATVEVGDVTDDFNLQSTKVGGYFREQVEGVTRGWVVSDALELKGVTSDEAGGKTATTTSGFTSPPLSSSDQQLIGVTENPSAPPETQAFFKARRCSSLRNQYDTAANAYLDSSGTVADANAANLALAKGRVLGCSWTSDGGRSTFITT